MKRPVLGFYQTYIPRPPLTAFVRHFWYYEGSARSHTKERRLPNGSLELVINLRDDEMRVSDGAREDRCRSLRGSVISGAHTTCFLIDTSCLISVMGVAFKPGGALSISGLATGELHNRHVSLEDLWGTAACELRDQLLEAGTPLARFSLLEQLLLARMGRSLAQMHPAVDFALSEFQKSAPLRSVADVVVQTGLSARHFIQIFQERVGLTPKQFCRVRRFQEVLGLIERGERVLWSDVAVSCGYFDQAHLIHDFRDFSGLTPTMYLAQRGEFRNHVPLPG